MARIFTVHTPLGPETLKFRSLSGSEYLSRLFEFQLDMLSPSPDISVDSLLGQNVTVEVETQKLGRRYLNGEATRFALIGRQGRYYRYQAIVRPWMWYLTRASDCRIFQQMDAPAILSETFSKYPYLVEKRLTGSYRTWEYCVQYQETDFNFVSRLMEHEGIYYFFQHSMGQLKLVLADSPGAHQPLPEYADIPYYGADAAMTPDEEHFRNWIVSKEVDSGGFETDDYDFKKPRAILKQWNVRAFEHPNADYRIYDYPGGYSEIPDGEFYAKVRREELQAPHEVLHGESDARGLAPGYVFNLHRCPRADQNREYLVIGVDYFWRENPYEVSADSATRFQFTAHCQESSVQFRPQRITPKPLTNGPQTAVVVGPSSEEIYTDKYGRVKVQFYWDRYGNADENSSCWIRVSSSWAGSNWGQISLPRIGQEVIVDFINGDPDYPIIVGRVYNADHMPPYELPKYREYSTIKSRSTKKGGNNDWNELRFVDYKGKEQVFIHAQWRMDVRVKWNKYKTVKESYHCQVYKSHYRTIGGNYDLHVGKDLRIRIDGKQQMSLAGPLQLTCEGDYQVSADTKIEINSPSVTLEAKTSLTLKVGSNFVTIDPTGVTIQGTLVRINSGGFALPVAEFEFEDPDDASEADDGTPGFLDRPKTGKGQPKKKRKGGQHGLRSGFGKAVDDIVAKSPTLSGNLDALKKDGWTIKTGDPGKGSFTDKSAKTITIDPNEAGDPAAVAQTLAHESGHARYTQDPYVPPAGLTKDQYVSKNANSNLKDEGEATMTNAQVRDEVNKNGGPDIGIAGAQANQYQKIYEKYPDPADRDKARQEIGDAFADGEHPSNDPGKTYRDYYSKTYADYYDKHPPSP